ncbi:uncharacterized protein LOC124364955 [Homalodisca vitripennis]|nr:uncharacterized protein LOC124364955 [Homalodisca vitripennis]
MLSKESSTDEERTRLAPMAEMEEDDGRVTIKVDKAKNLKTLEHRRDFYSDNGNGNETTV